MSVPSIHSVTITTTILYRSHDNEFSKIRYTVKGMLSAGKYRDAKASWNKTSRFLRYQCYPFSILALSHVLCFDKRLVGYLGRISPAPIAELYSFHLVPLVYFTDLM